MNSILVEFNSIVENLRKNTTLSSGLLLRSDYK